MRQHCRLTIELSGGVAVRLDDVLGGNTTNLENEMTELLDQSWQQNIASSVAHWCEMAKVAIEVAAAQHERPSAVYKPRLSIDGNKWCALYGENLQSGVAGFGYSPDAAMWDFDRQWAARLPDAA